MPQSPKISLRLYDETIVYGKRVALDGRLGGMNRKEFSQLLESKGGQLVDLGDAQVDLVVIGAESGATSGAPSTKSISETQLWETLGFMEPESVTGRLYTPAMLAELLSVPVSTIRRWHRRGLIQPIRQFKKLPYFDFEEVASARRIARLIDSGKSAAAIESRLSKLAQDADDCERPLSQLSIIVQGKDVLLREGDGLIEPGGQQLLDFDSEETLASFDFDADGVPESQPAIIGFPLLGESDSDEIFSTDELLELAIDFEDEGDPKSALGCLRSLLMSEGPKPDIVFRIAELLYAAGDLTAARERYYQAIELEPSFVEARASLGCVLMELGENDLAISSFQGALDQHSNYPDVHFHLAKLFTESGQTPEAIAHWQSFIDLAPRSPWADQARAELEQLETL